MFRIRLKELREEKGMNQRELAAALHVSPGTIGMWESGAREPQKIEMLQGIANYFHVSTDYLLGNVDDPFFYLDNERIKRDINNYGDEEENEGSIENLTQKYRSLDQYGKEAVDGVLDVEWRRCTQPAPAEQPEPDNVVYITNWFPMPMSAGTGQPAGSDEPEELELMKRPPRGTSYVAPISGDSMEPTYHDGDKLFIRSCKEIEVGQVGVFLMDGQQWVKELGGNVLISHNDKYNPIPMRDDIECQGLVLGVCDESYFE